MVKTKEEIRHLILNSQVGIVKEYNKGDLLRFTFDVKNDIDSGADIFKDFSTALPKMLFDNKKVTIQMGDAPLKKAMRASCYVLSAAEVGEIIAFLDSLQSIIGQDSADKAKVYFKQKFGRRK